MCGIAGIINISGERECLAEPIERMTTRMKHRGPNDEGYLLADLEKREVYGFFGTDTPVEERRNGIAGQAHISTAYGMKTNLALGHRRLNIIDLSYRGHQPMSDENGWYWIVFNGEIYNYKIIRRELEREGHTFFSGTDTEVVLRAYMQWGDSCLQTFNGMFAFAIYDRARGEIFLARDRIGIKPLYYTLQGRHFIFASDIKTIIASGLYQPEVNWEGLWHNFSFSVAPRPMTVFKDVEALPQGEWMKIDLAERHFTRQRYWKIMTWSQQPSMSVKDAVDYLELHLTESIRQRLVADVEVGIFMSGGIDSTTVAALASTIHPGITAFTLAFDGTAPEYNELKQAREAARMHPIRHIVEIVKAEQVLENIDDMVQGYEEPMCTLSPNYLISKLIARHGIVVVLNGLGGDELFAGYSHYRDVAKWRLKRALAFFLPQPWRRYRQLKTIENFYVDQYAVITESEKKQLFLHGQDFRSLSVLGELYATETTIFSDDIEALSYYDLMSYIGNHHVYRIDQFTMQFSLEGRFPFLDHLLVEFAFRIPSRYKITNKEQKWVLREVARKYIPPACLEMPKKGFGLPVGRWMRKELKPLTEDALAGLKKRGIFNNKEIDRHYLEFNQADPTLYKKVWHLVMTELWFRQFIDRKG